MMVINCYLFQSGGPYGAHEYWRLYATNNNGDASRVAVGTLEFKDSGGSTIATTGGTAIASSLAVGSAAANAFDGDVSTVWQSSTAANEWIGYHFASAVSVAQVLPYTTTAAISINRAPKDCILQYSDDGSTWTDAFSFTNYLPIKGYGETYPYSAPASGYHRAWRLLCDNANGGTSIRIDELELRATSGGADQTNGVLGSADGNTVGRTFSSTNTVGGEYWKAFDDTAGTLWISVGSTNQHVGFVFPAAVKVEEISVKGSSDGTRSPKDMHVQYSDDGITWTTQKDLASQTAWSASETRVLAAI